MKTYEILQRKGSHVHSIAPTAFVSDVVAKLVEKNVGSLLVIDNDKLVGIITERDILRCCANDQRPLTDIRVAEKMTNRLVTAAAHDSVDSVMRLMTANRVRHLPIVDDEDQLAGVISIGDTVKAQHDQLSMENEYLKSYLHS